MADRSERLLALLSKEGLDALLVTALPNVRYLTGYSGSNGLAVVGPRTRAFLTDFRYAEQVAEEVDPTYDRRTEKVDLLDGVSDVLPDGELRLGFDDSNLTVRQHAQLRASLAGRVELVPASGLVERLRVVKEPEEIACIRTAAAAADAAFTHVLEGGLIGRTERELSNALEAAMRSEGARRASFDTIVAAGPHGALPHATPRPVEVARGELVVIDWGAELDGYCSDCTRTVAAGEPSGEAREIYELVLAAQLTGLEAVRPGVGGREVDAAARAVISTAGHGEHFGHGLGHGVGLQTHEGPRLSLRSDEQLQAGNVVTIEPGVYLPGRLGVRIEDLVVVADDGPQILSPLDKQLTICG